MAFWNRRWNLVLGDVLIDWDLPKAAAVWTWSAFDHLDLSARPLWNCDWTHGNAVIYSPDDGDILSRRNQNCVIKSTIEMALGTVSVLWRFGPGGDFTLPSSASTHRMELRPALLAIQSPNSSGIFSLMFFNNGNNRLVDSNNDVCGSAGVGAATVVFRSFNSMSTPRPLPFSGKTT